MAENTQAMGQAQSQIDTLNKEFAKRRDIISNLRSSLGPGGSASGEGAHRQAILQRLKMEEMKQKKNQEKMRQAMSDKKRASNVKLYSSEGSISGREQEIKDRLMGGLAKGREMGQQRFGGDRDLQGMTGNILDMLKRQATQGLGAQQFRQIRSDAAAQLASQQKMGLRNLLAQQGASGIRGAAAQAGIGNLQQAGAMARSGLEANLASQDVGLRQAGMQALRDAVNRERLGQLSTEFGVAGLMGQARSQAAQEALARAALEKGIPMPQMSNPFAANTSGGFLGQMRRGLDKI